MKLLLSLLLSLSFLISLTASAHAIHAEIPSETQAVVASGNTQLTLSGELRVRGWYLDNYSNSMRSGSGTPKDTNTQNWYDQRVRLGVKADVSKNTTGYFMIEGAPDEGGMVYNLDVYKWGTMNAKPGVELVFLEAWLQHKGSGLLGIPSGVKAGHMLIALGEKQFYDHTKQGSDVLLFFADPVKDLHVAFWTAKFAEYTTTTVNSNDYDMYAILSTYKISKDHSLGLNYSYVSDKAPRVDATTGKPVELITNGSLQNLGLHANGQISGISYKAEADFQFGDAPSTTTATTTYDGYGLFLSLGYKLNPVNIRGEFALGSGDVNTSDNKNSEFQTILGNDVHYTFIYDYTTRGASSTRVRSKGIANTTYYRLGLDYSPMKDLTASLDGFILRATKVAAGSRDIGAELDAKLTYKIDRNLTYFINAGYLSPGQWWVDNASLSPTDKKAITQAVHGVTFIF